MIENFHHAKLEELSIYDASTDSDLLQLSPGPLDFRATKVELPEVRLQWNRLGASLRTREFSRFGPSVRLRFAQSSPAAGLGSNLRSRRRRFVARRGGGGVHIAQRAYRAHHRRG